MLAGKVVGRKASTKKYDILTALGAYALSQNKGLQRLSLRLMVLITARYNWQRDELSMGRKEIARLWGVNERTVKREMAKFRELGWVRVKTPAARGRVATYSIAFNTISKATQESWPAVGPDFVERMAGLYPASVVKVDFARAGQGAPVKDTEDTTGVWAEVQTLLRTDDESVFKNWFSRLGFIEYENRELVISAPNSFVARYIETHLSQTLMAAAVQVLGPINRLRFEQLG